jgi:hypothetical protein
MPSFVISEIWRRSVQDRLLRSRHTRHKPRLDSYSIVREWIRLLSVMTWWFGVVHIVQMSKVNPRVGHQLISAGGCTLSADLVRPKLIPAVYRSACRRSSPKYFWFKPIVRLSLRSMYSSVVLTLLIIHPLYLSSLAVHQFNRNLNYSGKSTLESA